MHIKHVEIGNFRKLKTVRIDFTPKTTVFVGANNSGKTSAMVALRRFLIERSEFSINDFTLSHWSKIDAGALKWESATDGEELEPIEWDSFTPFLDVWLDVSAKELHYVQKILPTLDWDGTSIGVRLRFEPKDTHALQFEYLTAKRAAAEVMAKACDGNKSEEKLDVVSTFALWPRSMMEFLAQRLRSTFEVRAYLLDPAKLKVPENGKACPQVLPDNSDPINGGDPFHGLIRIDEISAQRGFGHAGQSGGARNNDSQDDFAEPRVSKRLSSQLRNYYTQHLDPFDTPEPKDLEALLALHEAQTAFGKRLADCFSDALAELEDIGYPGVTDPKLTITTNIKPIDGLNHSSAVQYEVPTHLAGTSGAHRLPEDSNGLGYQNLVSIVFALMGFRDKWMKVGKAGKSKTSEEALIPPLHLVLIEEPEAHLHAQVQQVFIKQAYGVLRKHDKLKESPNLQTQLVVSTHSSHLAHEADFASLRYFRRLPAPTEVGAVPLTSVVNLSEIFDGLDKTERFVKRYLKATHCDLFFADGAILVEGPAERILVPHFVREREVYAYLKRSYITWLEIGGSHAHRLKKLIEHLGLSTLIITDIDAKDSITNAAVVPKRGAGQRARNETVKTWIPNEESLDVLLDMKSEKKVLSEPSGYAVRVAYQTPITVKFKSKDAVEALANTFEDALVYENMELFTKLDGHGLIAKFRDALTSSADLAELGVKVSDALKNGTKAEFALDILFSEEVDQLKVPIYIHEGLAWLAEQLKRKEDNIIGKVGAKA
ncbi:MULTISPECIES: AAA family ATPase [unclassified Serratia (in: enterobacteria)]|uniref:AAA family ATPase n=1 Tax=unclassified Serratia (in: enterobacteria) TaxID=2647522 RepID=UPI000502A081|nr:MULTISPECIES: AAA family ATPase [unclassified Serratia (in: enterobacteria)]KFK95666.1 DNA helicase [Serratia sp. Ag2]KFK95990.1 DNA helicase [Serratia sp. Ag1]